MAFKFSYTVVCAVVATIACMTVVMSAPTDFESQLSARATDAVCDTRRAAPYWQSYSSEDNDHFYSADYYQMNASTNLGYKIQSRSGFIFREPVVSTAGFYRLYDAEHVDHFYTTNETEADELIRRGVYRNRGYVGYIYTSAVCGAVPLYRLYDSGQYDHYYTTSEEERDYWDKHGYTYQGIAGYILPNL
ncbi:hypothetical protein C8Q72DRAFT_1003643 [Fomitopsis betulina]|nr:hypothetical protein C8Q72DRAFT_1003643 [Fomitopsis betulina]